VGDDGNGTVEHAQYDEPLLAVVEAVIFERDAGRGRSFRRVKNPHVVALGRLGGRKG
jgi:hypothetical protein